MNHRKTIVSVVTVALILLMATSVVGTVHNSGLPKSDDIYYKAYVGAPPEVVVDEFIGGVTDWIGGPSRLDLYNKVLGNSTTGEVHDVSAMDPMSEFTFFPINGRDYKETSGDPNGPLNDSTWRLALSYVYGMDDKQADIFDYYGVPWHSAQRNVIPDAQTPWFDGSITLPNTSNFTAWNSTMAPNGYSVADYSGQPWLYRNGVVVRPPDGPNTGRIRCLYSTGALFYEQGPLLGMVTAWNTFITDYVGANGPLMELTPVDFGTLVTDLLLLRDYDIIGIGLTNMGVNVDWLYDCFHSDNDVPWGWNFVGVHDAEYDAWTEIILTSMSEAQIIAAARNFTLKFVFERVDWVCVRVGLEFCTTANGTTNHQGHLTNVISMDNYGPSNDYSWMAMHWEGTPGVTWPGGSFARGLGDSPDTLNPLTDNTLYGWQFMDRAVIGLLARSPTTLELMPMVATNWTVDAWTSIPELGIASGSTATFHIRQDVKWQDYGVTGEMVDAYDCVANMRFMREYHPGRYSSTWANLVYEEAAGPYTFNVYFDQTSLYYAIYVAGGSLLVPEHIYKAIDENVTGGLANYEDWSPGDDAYQDLTGKAPPAAYPWMKQIVGAGPFVYRNYDRGLATGRVTKYDDFFVSAPVIAAVYGPWLVAPLTSYEYQPLIHNFGAKEAVDEGLVTSVTVDVKITDDDGSFWVNGTTLDPWEWTYLPTYTVSAANTTIGIHTITVEVYGSGLLHTYVHTYVATVREDLNTYANVLLDFKVDMRDIGVAARAFGSYPGHLRWAPVADVNDDFKVDMRDIGACARRFGWP